MSIDDHILIETDKDFKEVAKLFLEQVEFLIEKIHVTEEEDRIGIDYAHWNAGIGTYYFSRNEHEEKLGIKPNISIFVTLNKKHIQEARIEMLRILLKLVQAANLSLAWFHNYDFPVMVYRKKRFILKSDDMFWRQHANLLQNSEIEYQDLPQF